MIGTMVEALLIGAGIGVLTGLFGVGGGFLITPILNIVLGVPMPIAVGTGAMQILGVTTAGLYARRKEAKTDFKMAVMLFGGNYVGVSLGAETLTALGRMGEWTIRGRDVAAVDVVILAVFFVLLTGIAIYLIYDSRRKRVEGEARPGLLSKVRVPPYTAFQTLNDGRLSIVALTTMGLFLGFLTGLLGIGGGVVLVPALLYLVGMPMHAASATSMAMVWLTSFLATITHTQLGNTSLALAIPLLVGGTLGVQAGANLCNRLRAQLLKRYFSLVVVAAALLVAIKLFGILF
jgi:uncharacterized membrane protein YfcA